MPQLTVYEKNTCTTCTKLTSCVRARRRRSGSTSTRDRAVLARPVERVLDLLGD